MSLWEDGDGCVAAHDGPAGAGGWPWAAPGGGCWVIDMSGAMGPPSFTSAIGAGSVPSAGSGKATSSRSSEPSRRAAACSPISEAARRRRLSDHGCGCRSFSDADRADAASAKLQAWRRWQAQAAADAASHRGPDQPLAGGDRPSAADTEPKAKERARTHAEAAPKLPVPCGGCRQPGSAVAVPAPKVADAPLAGGCVLAHQRLSALLDAEDGPDDSLLPLSAFAVLSVTAARGAAP